jgi:hypothetical protein
MSPYEAAIKNRSQFIQIVLGYTKVWGNYKYKWLQNNMESNYKLTNNFAYA